MHVKIALYSKNDEEININPCDIMLLKHDKKPVKPDYYTYSFLHTWKKTCYCYKPSTKLAVKNNDIDFKDILTIENRYPVTCFPKEKVTIIIPHFTLGSKEVSAKEFIFKKGSGFLWTSIL